MRKKRRGHGWVERSRCVVAPHRALRRRPSPFRGAAALPHALPNVCATPCFPRSLQLGYP